MAALLKRCRHVAWGGSEETQRPARGKAVGGCPLGLTARQVARWSPVLSQVILQEFRGVGLSSRNLPLFAGPGRRYIFTSPLLVILNFKSTPGWTIATSFLSSSLSNYVQLQSNCSVYSLALRPNERIRIRVKEESCYEVTSVSECSTASIHVCRSSVTTDVFLLKIIMRDGLLSWLPSFCFSLINFTLFLAFLETCFVSCLLGNVFISFPVCRDEEKLSDCRRS